MAREEHKIEMVWRINTITSFSKRVSSDKTSAAVKLMLSANKKALQAWSHRLVVDNIYIPPCSFPN